MSTQIYRSTAKHPDTGNVIQVDWEESLTEEQVLKAFEVYIRRQKAQTEKQIRQRKPCHIWQPGIVRKAIDLLKPPAEG